MQFSENLAAVGHGPHVEKQCFWAILDNRAMHFCYSWRFHSLFCA